MEGLGIFAIAIYLLLFVAAILALLMPFFVLRIRNEMISINKKMSTLINLLQNSEFKDDMGKIEGSKYSERMIKICPDCGRKNRLEDNTCTNCGKSPI
ncbi:MAG: zinc ribbon domain-containing protein [Desulfobacteraceae bacterium]|nr:zinc ribbon domain-containing protein [Desulfobacteraceae bacterium]